MSIHKATKVIDKIILQGVKSTSFIIQMVSMMLQDEEFSSNKKRTEVSHSGLIQIGICCRAQSIFFIQSQIESIVLFQCKQVLIISIESSPNFIRK